MIITSANLAALNRGFKTLFLEAYQGGGNVPKVDTFAMRTQSMSADELYGWLGAIPGLRELIGEVQIRNLVDHNFRIANKEFESTIGVKRADIERDRFGIYNPLFQAMGISARSHPDELLAATMLAGFTTLCYTGKNFFDNNHEPQAKKTKFSNLATKKLSAANYQIARANIKNRKNAEGRSMNLGSDLVLVVSPTWEDVGRSIVVADLVGGGNTNVNKGTARLEVWPLLSGSEDAWFLFDLGYPVKPFINQIELDTEFVSLDDLRSEHVLLKKEYLHQAYRRGNVGLGMPELAYGSTGADAA